MITQQGVVKGLEQLRPFFAQMLEMLSAEPMAAFDLQTKVIEGDVAFHAWTAGPRFPFGAETYVIRGGKIVSQTVGLLMPA